MDNYCILKQNENVGACTKCTCSCESSTLKQASDRLHTPLLCAVSTTFFVFSCLTLVCNIWILKENLNTKKEITMAVHEKNTGLHELQAVVQSTDKARNIVHQLFKRATDPKRHRKPNRNKGLCKCKRGRRGKPGKNGEKGQQGERGLQGPKGDTGAQGESFSMMAAHYTSDFNRDIDMKSTYWETTENGYKKYVLCNRQWEGTVCRNKTYTSMKKSQRIEFLQKSSWNKIQNPFVDNQQGLFKAKATGIYLFYFHVVFYDDAPKEEIVLIHHRTNANTDTVLRCIEGNDSFIHGPQKLKNKKMKTCSITSVLYVQQNDTIEIQNKIAGTTIDLTKDATYFGAVLMSPL